MGGGGKYIPFAMLNSNLVVSELRISAYNAIPVKMVQKEHNGPIVWFGFFFIPRLPKYWFG